MRRLESWFLETVAKVSPTFRNFCESAGNIESNLSESLAALEIEMDNAYWTRLSSWGKMEFSDGARKRLIETARIFFLKNPLIKRCVELTSNYVFGRGVSISSKDPKLNAVIQTFLADNASELSIMSLREKNNSLKTDGNLFFALFVDQSTGRARIRTIDPMEITDLITDPDDASVTWFYRRDWTDATFNFETGTPAAAARCAYYPSIDLPESQARTMIGSIPVMKEPVLHAKRGGLAKWRFGLPEIYASLDWARAYTQFLENWGKITQSLARFSWKGETKGGKPAIDAMSAALQTSIGQSEFNRVDRNPPPLTGSAFVSDPSTAMKPIRTAGATTGPEEGRRVGMMALIGNNIPEHIGFGDISGTYATSKNMDRPTEITFLMEQEHWKEIFTRLLKYVLMTSATRANGALKEAAIDPSTIDIKVSFPPILEKDLKDAVSAVADAMTLGNKLGTVVGIDEKTGVRMLLQLLSELAEIDIEAILKVMYPEGSYDPDRTKEEENEPAPPPNPATLAKAAESLSKLAEVFRESKEA